MLPASVRLPGTKADYFWRVWACLWRDTTSWIRRFAVPWACQACCESEQLSEVETLLVSSKFLSVKGVAPVCEDLRHFFVEVLVVFVESLLTLGC